MTSENMVRWEMTNVLDCSVTPHCGASCSDMHDEGEDPLIHCVK